MRVSGAAINHGESGTAGLLYKQALHASLNPVDSVLKEYDAWVHLMVIRNFSLILEPYGGSQFSNGVPLSW